jgi:hypothetical protein
MVWRDDRNLQDLSSQPAKSQGDYYRQQDPTEVPPSHDPSIDDRTKPVNNDSCADDPMSRNLRAHPRRDD